MKEASFLISGSFSLIASIILKKVYINANVPYLGIPIIFYTLSSPRTQLWTHIYSALEWLSWNASRLYYWNWDSVDDFLTTWPKLWSQSTHTSHNKPSELIWNCRVSWPILVKNYFRSYCQIRIVSFHCFLQHIENLCLSLSELLVVTVFLQGCPIRFLVQFVFS